MKKLKTVFVSHCFAFDLNKNACDCIVWAFDAIGVLVRRNLVCPMQLTPFVRLNSQMTAIKRYFLGHFRRCLDTAA